VNYHKGRKHSIEGEKITEPLAKQAALVYNLLRKVYRIRSSDMPSVLNVKIKK